MRNYTIIKNNKIFFFLNIFLFFTILSGCSNVHNLKTFILTKIRNKNFQAYYEFCDILIPIQLKINKKKTSIFRTSRFSVGVLSLKGRMKVSDIFLFFEKNMCNDNWSILNTFQSKKSIMLFKKDNRTCVICITDYKQHSQTEIWILPDKEISLPEISH